MPLIFLPSCCLSLLGSLPLYLWLLLLFHLFLWKLPLSSPLQYLCSITGALRFTPEISFPSVCSISPPPLLPLFLSSFASSLSLLSELTPPYLSNTVSWLTSAQLTPPSPHRDLSHPTTLPLIICAYPRAANDQLERLIDFSLFSSSFVSSSLFCCKIKQSTHVFCMDLKQN